MKKKIFELFQQKIEFSLNFRLSEKDTKFEKIFHLEFDPKSNVKFFQILCPSQNDQTLSEKYYEPVTAQRQISNNVQGFRPKWRCIFVL